jgi:hypothetical protein
MLLTLTESPAKLAIIFIIAGIAIVFAILGPLQQVSLCQAQLRTAW